MNAPLAGVDVGGTNIRVIVGDSGGPRLRAPVPADYDGFLDRVAGLLDDGRREAGLPLAGVGIGLPGIAGGRTATFVPALPYLDGRPVGADLADRIGAPVTLANDAQCALLAEARLGAARGHDHAALVVVGTGIGGAMLVHGHLYPGGQGAAGAFGWLPAQGADVDARHGAWEQVASGRALTARAAGLGLDAAALMDRAAAGDETCAAVADEYGYALGRGLAAVASAWDPRILVIGGVIIPYLVMLSSSIARAFDDWASPAGRQVARVAAQLGTDAGVLGALCLADQTRRAQ